MIYIVQTQTYNWYRITLASTEDLMPSRMTHEVELERVGSLPIDDRVELLLGSGAALRHCRRVRCQRGALSPDGCLFRRDRICCGRIFRNWRYYRRGAIFTHGKHSLAQSLWHSIAARFAHAGIERRLEGIFSSTMTGPTRSTEQFLDSRMQYSEADFTDPHCSLDEAQLAKLERICLDLKLQPAERLLDIGCGWGD